MIQRTEGAATAPSSGDLVWELRRRAAAALAGAAANTPVAGVYAGLVLLLWLPFGWKSGMPYETAFPFNSETTSFFDGFFYSDPLRVYTSVFYNLGYHLSDWLGVGGSFLGYQLVYAALWWARGLLGYLIVQALFPRHRVFAFVVGALLLVHASDHAINWVGQMNQYGMIFWTLLAIYMLVLALKAKTIVAAGALTLLAMFFARLALWSYESPLFIVLATPILLLALRFRFSRRTSLVTVTFYLVPLLYIWDSYRRYTTTGSSTYQESVLRKDISPVPILSDLWFNVTNSLQFWNWGLGLPSVSAHSELIWVSSGGAALAGAAVAGGAVLLRQEELVPSRRAVAWLLGCGMMILLASFPAYVILSSARQLWRTQFLSGLGAALVLASIVAMLATVVPWRTARVGMVAVFAGAVAYFGVAASFTAASYHSAIWQRHRTAMAEVLSVAPRLKPGTLVVLTNVSRTADPFGDNMWFDVALRLAYPHVPVAGVYFYAGGVKSPHQNMVVRSGRWVSDGTGFPTLLQSAPFRNTVVVRLSSDGHGKLVRRVPRFVNASPTVAAAYAPAARIDPGLPPAPARRRYEPIPHQ